MKFRKALESDFNVHFTIYQNTANGGDSLFYKTQHPGPGSVGLTFFFKDQRFNGFNQLKLLDDGFINHGIDRINTLELTIFEAVAKVKNKDLYKCPRLFFKKAAEIRQKWIDFAQTSDITVSNYKNFSRLFNVKLVLWRRLSRPGADRVSRQLDFYCGSGKILQLELSKDDQTKTFSDSTFFKLLPEQINFDLCQRLIAPSAAQIVQNFRNIWKHALTKQLSHINRRNMECLLITLVTI